MTDHNEQRHALGSYLLGALDPAERAEFEAHLTHCPECREELARSAGIPGLLSRLTLEDATGDSSPQPVAPPLPSLLDRVRRERSRQHRRLRRWQAGTAAAALAAASLLGVTVLSAQTPPADRFTAAAGVTAAGQLIIDPKPWGTQLHLTVHLPPASAYVAYAVSPTGTRTVAATWGPTPSSRMTLDAATNLRPSQLRAVEIATTTGTPLLHLER